MKSISLEGPHSQMHVLRCQCYQNLRPRRESLALTRPSMTLNLEDKFYSDLTLTSHGGHLSLFKSPSHLDKYFLGVDQKLKVLSLIE